MFPFIAYETDFGFKTTLHLDNCILCNMNFSTNRCTLFKMKNAQCSTATSSSVARDDDDCVMKNVERRGLRKQESINMTARIVKSEMSGGRKQSCFQKVLWLHLFTGYHVKHV